MATPSEKLAESLKVLKDHQDVNGSAAIQARDISRTHRERLVKAGFLEEVMKGWYVPSRPDERPGDSTSWYASYWRFCSSYLTERFGKNWCLSAEQSLLIHGSNMTIPKQLLVRSPAANNNTVNLLHDTSLYDLQAALPGKGESEEKDGLRIFTLAASLITATPGMFTSNPIDCRTALLTIRDASEILPGLLDGGRTVVAGRLAGAFRNIGKDRIADDIIKTMQQAGYDVRETDPFASKVPGGTGRPVSPYVTRLRIMWQEMREPVVKTFPSPPGLPKDRDNFFKQVQEIYVTDAYHSLSIEGYRVTPELIKKVMSGTWDPAGSEEDRKQRDAMAAKGYHDAYQEVLKSLKKVLAGKNPGQVADDDHGNWYRALFSASVGAGLLKPRDLAGYRNDQVYIRASMHVPLNHDALKDAMPEFFELLKAEPEASVRAVLGHFIFVYIHPYMDGNGRTSRFLMNVMLASGGYPWTVVPVETRKEYFGALEKASVDGDIRPFADFLSRLVSSLMKGNPQPKIPES